VTSVEMWGIDSTSLGSDRQGYLWGKPSQVIKETSEALLSSRGSRRWENRAGIGPCALLRQGTSPCKHTHIFCLYFLTLKNTLKEKLPTPEAASCP